MLLLSKARVDYETIVNYASRGASGAHLAVGSGEAHVYMTEFDGGGGIGRHEAGFGQLFVILSGSGWVSGDDGRRVEVGTGDVVYFQRGEHHAKGSDTGMRALMVQVRDLTLSDTPGATHTPA